MAKHRGQKGGGHGHGHSTTSSMSMSGKGLALIGLLFVGTWIWIWMQRRSNNGSNGTRPSIIHNNNHVVVEPGSGSGSGWSSWNFPPLKTDSNWFAPFMGSTSGSVLVPINQSTQVGAVDAPYTQLGILTPEEKGDVLPLMGRPLFTNRNKYQYYTISNQRNQVKLPVQVRGHNGMDEYGVDQVYDQDTVYVNNTIYRVTLYPNATPRYL